MGAWVGHARAQPYALRRQNALASGLFAADALLVALAMAYLGLLERGASPHARDRWGTTPADAAKAARHADVARLLGRRQQQRSRKLRAARTVAGLLGGRRSWAGRGVRLSRVAVAAVA